MEPLTNQQMEQLNQAIARKLASESPENHELRDHLASWIESVMAEGSSFDHALQEVLGQFSRADLSALNQQTFDLWNRIHLRRLTNKYGLITGLLLCLWIGIEYLTGTFMGITELGAFYGLLSMVVLYLGVHFGSRHLTTLPGSMPLSFRQLLGHQFMIVLKSALVVTLFLLPYLEFINTNLYGLYEPEPPISQGTMSISIIMGTFIGVLFEGLLVSLLATWWQRRGLKRAVPDMV